MWLPSIYTVRNAPCFWCISLKCRGSQMRGGRILEIQFNQHTGRLSCICFGFSQVVCEFMQKYKRFIIWVCFRSLEKNFVSRNFQTKMQLMSKNEVFGWKKSFFRPIFWMIDTILFTFMRFVILASHFWCYRHLTTFFI